MVQGQLWGGAGSVRGTAAPPHLCPGYDCEQLGGAWGGRKAAELELGALVSHWMQDGAGLPPTPCVTCTVNRGHTSEPEIPSPSCSDLWETQCCQWKARYRATVSLWGIVQGPCSETLWGHRTSMV